ncbi:MAG: PAS domain S-box protein [Vicinamibacterales bacterium]
MLPTNALQQLPLIVSIVAASFGVGAVALYALARRGHHYPGLFFAMQLAMLSIGWFPNAGTGGSMPYFFVPICYVMMFYDGPRMWLLSLTAIANALALTIVEHYVPSLVTPFRSAHDRTIDLSVGLVVSGFTCALILWFAITGYRRERAKLQVALASQHESEERFEQIFRMNPDAVFIYGRSNPVFLEVNDGFTRLTGYTREDALGRSATDLNLWVDESERRGLRDLAERNVAVAGYLARFRRKDGEIFWGSTSTGVVELRHDARRPHDDARRDGADRSRTFRRRVARAAVDADRQH